MEGKLDAVLSEMRSGLREAHTRLDRHEVDIQSLKDLRTEATGIFKATRWFWLAVVGAVSGIAAAIATFAGLPK
jgi:hypothetical protein